MLGIFCFSSGIECSVIVVLGKTEHKPSRTECSAIWCSAQHCRAEANVFAEVIYPSRAASVRAVPAQNIRSSARECSDVSGHAIP